MRITVTTVCRIVPACAIMFLAAIAGCGNSGTVPAAATAPGATAPPPTEASTSVPASPVESTSVLTGPPESAIQVLQDDGFPPAVIGIPLPPNATDMAESPADINNENNPQELVIVYDSPSDASAAAVTGQENLASAGNSAITVSIKDGGYAVVIRGSTSDFQQVGLG